MDQIRLQTVDEWHRLNHCVFSIDERLGTYVWLSCLHWKSGHLFENIRQYQFHLKSWSEIFRWYFKTWTFRNFNTFSKCCHFCTLNAFSAWCNFRTFKTGLDFIFSFDYSCVKSILQVMMIPLKKLTMILKKL